MITAIINPKSGSAGDDFRERVEEALKAGGGEYEVLETTPEKGGNELAQQAIKNGARHLLACGGDGTVMSVVNGIGASGLADAQEKPQVTLSIIPGGTANLLAGALKIPTSIEEAAKVAVEGQDFPLDLGTCGKHWFALGLGVGLTEKLVSQTSAKEKEKLGKLAYAKAMLRELGMKPHRFTLKLNDDAEFIQAGVAIVVANAGEIGGGLKFAPDAKMDDGVLDVCILRRFYFRDVLRLTWRSILGTMPDDRAVNFYQAKRVEIKSQPPLDLQIDGEEVDQEVPLVAQVVPHAILVRVPAPDDNALLPISLSQAPSALRIIIRLTLFILPLLLGAAMIKRKRSTKSSKSR